MGYVRWEWLLRARDMGENMWNGYINIGNMQHKDEVCHIFAPAEVSLGQIWAPSLQIFYLLHQLPSREVCAAVL